MRHMIGIFSRTTELYDALADEIRLSILILGRAKEKMEFGEFMKYLGEKDEETLEHHLNVLEKVKLIQKREASYSLTGEGIRRLSELGVTESEAIELVKERETSLEFESLNKATLISGSHQMVKTIIEVALSEMTSHEYKDTIAKMLGSESVEEEISQSD
ncbi:MAG: hypothetical protein HXS54_16115 [Theionarchaea archaeon]|nr:hypothetical protein [Theionarchaea archaeon]